MEAKRTKESQGELIASGRKLGGSFKPGFDPALAENRYCCKLLRLKLFNEFKKRVEDAYNSADKPEITITVKNGVNLS